MPETRLPPIEAMRTKLEEKLKKSMLQLPPAQVEDLYRNQFHGRDLPFYYESVKGGKLVPEWKAGPGKPKAAEAGS